jgi:glucose-1-phosphate thymidylyltransferase
MKGIVLAGGSGTRLYPATLAVNKRLLPIYDKPMIYYSISVLTLASICDILLISSPEQINSFKSLLGDGRGLGLSFTYAKQLHPRGIAQAFHIGREFLSGQRCCLILADNLFFGHNFAEHLERVASRRHGATIFGYHVDNPEHYGVVCVDEDGKAVEIAEKPKQYISNWAVPGLYFYDTEVHEIACTIKPSARGELEIADINRAYLERGLLNVELIGRGFARLDTGMHDSLLEAAEFVLTIQHRQGL